MAKLNKILFLFFFHLFLNEKEKERNTVLQHFAAVATGISGGI
jgi:hypothetical protein